MYSQKIIKDNRILLLIGIIILIMFFYFCYKIENGNSITYENPITGEIMQDIVAKKVSYIILTVLSVYTILTSYFLQEKMKEKELKIENIFLCIIPVFCVLLMFAMPMSKGHDETIHGLRVYEYAEGKFISNGVTAYLEEGVTKALDNKDTYNDIFNKENNYSTDTNKIEWGYRIAAYSPINYLPQIIGIAISRLVTNNSMIHLYVARLCNIITCIIMLYYAIKIIPYGKNLLFLLSLIPISIEGFATISADGMIISTSFLFIAYILNLREDKNKKISKKDIAILTILSIIIALSKTIYIVLLPILLLIPKEKWGSLKKKTIIFSLICIISAILDIGWYLLGIKQENMAIENNALSYILNDPFLYIQKIIYTIVINFQKYVGEIFGSTIEWNENVDIYVFPYILLIISIILIIKGKEKLNLSVWDKVVISIVILSCIFLIFTSMFLGWSKVDINYIEGIQGRYFIPIIPLIFLLFGKRLSDDKNLTKIITIIGLIMQIYVIMELVLYHI